MKTLSINIFICLFITTTVFSQRYYSKTFDPFNKSDESITDVILDSNQLILRGIAYCGNQKKLCTILGKYSTQHDSFTIIKRAEEIEAGSSLLEISDGYLLSSEKRESLNGITLNKINKELNFKNSINLKLDNNRFQYYTIQNSIKYRDKYIVAAQVEDSLDLIGIDRKQKSVLFVLDKNLALDTILLISPGSGYILDVENFAISTDSMLYISFNYTYDAGFGWWDDRKVIYGYNKQFKKIFSWQSDKYNNQVEEAALLIGKDNTIYTNSYYKSRTYLIALDKNGDKKWVCPFDSVMIQGGWEDFNLIMAKNGDIIGSATYSSAENDIGVVGYLFRISPEGYMKWNRVIRVNKGFDQHSNTNLYGLLGWFTRIKELKNGDLVAVGKILNYEYEKYPKGTYDEDLWIVKTDSTGCLWKNCPYIQDVVQKPKYLPIVTSRNEWVSYNANPFPGDPNPINTLTFTSDSFLLNNKYYLKPKFKNSLNNIWKTGSAYFREKNGIVYFRKDANTAENILYNFNLGIGDTLPAVGDPKGIRIVEKVSTVIYADGIPRKMMTYAKPCQRVVVEGIGDIGAPFYSQLDCTLTNEYYEVTRCFSTDGKLIYKALGIQGCFTVAVKDVDVRLKSIYPNPTTGLLNIDTEDAQAIKSVTIVDNLGRIIQTDAFMATDNGIQLNISNLQNGLYFGKVVFSDGSKTGFKIIKVSE